jgi:hypothetical protein
VAAVRDGGELVLVAEPGRDGGDLGGFAGEEGVDEGWPEAAEGGGEAIIADYAVFRVGKVGTFDDAATADEKPAEDVLRRDGVERTGDARIDVDEAAVAVNGGGLLHVGVEGGVAGDCFVKELAEERVDLHGVIGIDDTDDGLGRDAGEEGDFVFGEESGDAFDLAVAPNVENSHRAIVSWYALN